MLRGGWIELTLAGRGLTDDASEHMLFNRNGVKPSNSARDDARNRTGPLSVEPKKPCVSLLYGEYRGSHPGGYGYSRYAAPKLRLRLQG